ncbi:MAG: hypothetical protein HY033_02915 [Ignavibacteriae bacterium]|nr:hypothetical protein [Ignavibacteriota bacterium]
MLPIIAFVSRFYKKIWGKRFLGIPVADLRDVTDQVRKYSKAGEENQPDTKR